MPLVEYLTVCRFSTISSTGWKQVTGTWIHFFYRRPCAHGKVWPNFVWVVHDCLFLPPLAAQEQQRIVFANRNRFMDRSSACECIRTSDFILCSLLFQLRVNKLTCLPDSVGNWSSLRKLDVCQVLCLCLHPLIGFTQRVKWFAVIRVWVGELERFIGLYSKLSYYSTTVRLRTIPYQLCPVACMGVQTWKKSM